MDVIRLYDLPNDAARRLLATGVPVYLPVNPVEYHGPHLSLHTDRLISRGLTDRERAHPDLQAAASGRAARAGRLTEAAAKPKLAGKARAGYGAA